MHTDLMNQELARLHRAQTLRESRHAHVVEQTAAKPVERVVDGLLARVRMRVALWLHVPVARAQSR